MKRINKAILVFSLFFLFPLTFFSAILGEFEIMIPGIPPKEKSLDVVKIYEVFSFGCPHCFYLNNKIPKFKERFGKKVEIIPVPIGWIGPDPGRLYYIAKSKGKGEQVKDMIFDFYHVKGLGKTIYTRDKLQFVARMNGLAKEFKDLMDDPIVIKEMNDGIQMAEDKKIKSTPTFLVEGVLKASGNLENLFYIVNSLLKEPVK